MARLHSIATGNFTSSSTWGVIDTTSYNNSESATAVLTTNYSGARSTAFTPGAITISHIAVKYRDRATSPTGTLSVCLELDSNDTLVSGTEVTIDIADIPDTDFVNSTYYGNGAWLVLKLPTPVTLLAATAYQVAAKTSSSSQLTLYSSATTNLARYLVTTTTAAPAAGDDLVISGEYTGQGTFNSITVTMDNTSSTDFGSATTSLVTPSVAVCSNGKLTFGNAESTNYLLKISGHMLVYNNGTLEMGTVANPCPRSSTMTLNFDCASNGQFGLYMRYKSNLIMQGQSRTPGKNIVSTLLTADATANATSLSILDDTGWLDNDEIVIAGTGINVNEAERGALNGNATSNSLIIDGFGGVAGGLLYSHKGTNHLQADVIHVTRNVKITGASEAFCSFVNCQRLKTLDLDWVEFKFVGTNTNGKRGLTIMNDALDNNPCYIDYCSMVATNGIVGSYFIEASTSHTTSEPVREFGQLSVNNCVAYRSGLGSFNMPVILGPVSINNFIQISGGGTSIIPSTNLSLNNIKLVSFNNGIQFIHKGNQTTLPLQDAERMVINDLFIAGYGTSSGSAIEIDNYCGSSLIINNFTAIRKGPAIDFNGSMHGSIINNFVAIGCQYGIYADYNEGAVDLTIIDGIIASESGVSNCISALLYGSYPTNSPYSPSHSNITFVNCDFSGSGSYNGTTLAGTTEANIYLPGLSWVDNTRVKLYNCKFGTTPFDRNEFMYPDSVVTSYDHNQVVGDILTIRRNGYISKETTIVKSPNTTSFKMTPGRSVEKLELMSQNGGFKYRVETGNTLTISVAVQEDVTYNGNRARLVAKSNPLIGINEDIVLATATAASEGSWETITGSTPALTADGYLEFTIDCDGTAGSMYVDWPTVTKA